MSKRIISLEFSVNSVFKQKSAFEKIRKKEEVKISLPTNTVNAVWRVCGQGF